MEIPKWIHGILFEKKYRVVKHLLFWIFIYLDEILSFAGLTIPLDYPASYVLMEVLIDMAIVYFNIYYFLPKFFLQGKIMQYLFWTVISIIVVIILNNFIYSIDLESEEVLSIVITDIVTNSSLVFMAVAMKLFGRSYESNRQISALRESNLQTELAYLKTQVNPHFLFNTLNNVYVMAKKKDENVSETIMQLSDLLRYQLYECEADSVPLKNEINYIKNYLELEQIRRQSLKVDLEVNLENPHVKIRPLIFLPYIENAFKYSNSNSGTDAIEIKINTDKEKLKFSCKNSKGTLHNSLNGGIGLLNASRRLELSYPDMHSLDIVDTKDHFSVNVEIELV